MAAGENVQESALWRYQQTDNMSDTQFRQWVALLEARTGIALPASRKTFLVTNLNIRMRELGVTDYGQYYEYILDGSRGQIEWETLIDRLTVHETRFFRDMHALDLITDTYLKERINEVSSPYTFNVWSVGCATGEEPYSLAMVIDDALMQYGQGYYFAVTASDVSRIALNTGRNAIYHINRIKNIPEDITRRYLRPVDADHVQVCETLKQRVCFAHTNLLQLENQKVGMMDIIICQNVLIYFKREMRGELLSRLIAYLKPNGLLILGAGEVFGWTHDELEQLPNESTLAFKRRSVPADGETN